MTTQEVKRKLAAILSATADFQRHSRKCFEDFLSRQESRLSSRHRNFMLNAGCVMLLVFLYLIGGYMPAEQLLALGMSTVIGTVVGYFLVRDNAIAVIVSAGCTTIVFTIAQFLWGATMEEFIMWWPLAIFVFFIYSFVTTLVAFPLLDKYIASNKPGALEPESETISIEQDLRLEFNALTEKIISTKSEEEKARIRAERDRIEKEMNRLESQRFAAFYSNRGEVYRKKRAYDQALSDFSKAIELNPGYAEVYYNRGIAYYFKKEYDKSWEDIKRAQDLGYKIPAEFLNDLWKASGRQN